jgi:hypothetical protein
MQGQDISLPNNQRSSEIGTARGTRYSALQEGVLNVCIDKREERRRCCSVMLSNRPTIMGLRTRLAASGAGSVRFIGTRIPLSNR